MSDVFLSYSRKDEDLVRRLYDALKTRDRDAWVDWEGIPLSAEWMREIHAGIDSAQAFAFVLTSSSIQSEVCKIELGHAVEQNKRLIPIVCEALDAKEVPDALSRLNWIYLRTSDDFDASIDALIETIDTDLDWVKDHTRLLVRAREWTEERREASFLLRGKDLADAETWLLKASAGSKRQPTPLHTEYIVASRAAATKRLRYVVAAVVGALAVAVTLAVLAWLAEMQAKEQSRMALAGRLAAEGRAQLNQRLDVSLLLAAAAIDTKVIGVSRSALLTAVLSHSRLEAMLATPDTSLESVAFSPDGKVLAAASQTEVALWRVDKREPLGPPLAKYPDAEPRVAFSPDGKLLVTAGGDLLSGQGRVILWDWERRQQLPLSSGDSGFVSAVAFSPDGKVLAVVGARGNEQANGSGVIFYDVEAGKAIARIGSPAEPVNCVAFSRDGKRFATGSKNGELRVWDAATRLPIGPPVAGHKAEVWSIAISPDGKLLATGGWDVVKLWNAENLEPIGEPFSAPDGSGRFVEFHPSGKLLVAGGNSIADPRGKLSLWDVATRMQIGHSLAGTRAWIHGLAFSPDGNLLATAGGSLNRGELLLWNMSSDPPLRRTLAAPHEAFGGLAYSLDGKLLAAGDGKRSVRLWDVAAGGVLADLPLGSTSVAISPDGKLLAVAVPKGSNGKPEIIVWDTATREPLGLPMRGHDLPVNAMAVSPDGKLLATGGGTDLYHQGELIIWDLAHRQRMKSLPVLHEGDVKALEFSRDGKLLGFATAGDRSKVILWDLASEKSAGEVRPTAGQYFTGFSFHPDGTAFATTAASQFIGGGSLTLWDLHSRHRTAELLMPGAGGMASVAFSANGDFLASGTINGSVELWDVASRKRIGDPLAGHMGAVVGLAFGPEGRSLATGDLRSAVALWNVDPTYLRQRACAMANRNLTCGEWLALGTGTPYNRTCPQHPHPPDIEACEAAAK